MHLRAGERVQYKLQLPEGTTGAWVRVRETIPSPQLSPVLAVSGATECLEANELHTTIRDLAWPSRNPWYSGDVSEGDKGILALINTSESPVRVWGCYSFGVLYSVPHNDRPCGRVNTGLFGNHRGDSPAVRVAEAFRLARGGNSHVSLATRGDKVVLHMLRPEGTSVKVYRVDSTITFGKEAAGQ